MESRGPEGVVPHGSATFQVLTSGGRYGGLLALPPLFLPFFFFPFGPPQLLLPPAPRALRFPPMAGPPPGRQQPPNSSDTRESIRRCHQPPARPLPPRHCRRPYCHRRVGPAGGERGVAQCRPRPCLPSPPSRVRKSRRASRDTESAAMRFSAKECKFELQFPRGTAMREPQVASGAWAASAP